VRAAALEAQDRTHEVRQAHLVLSEYDRNVLGPPDARHAVQPRQIDLQHLAVKKQQRGQGCDTVRTYRRLSRLTWLRNQGIGGTLTQLGSTFGSYRAPLNGPTSCRAHKLLGQPVKRRELILGLLAIGIGIAIVTHAGAQTAASPLSRVVIISGGDEAGFRSFGDRFLHGMREHGQAVGRTFRLEVQYAHGEPARSAKLIREALAGRPDVLVVAGLTSARRAREATNTVPVVVATSSDLVDAGIVASFAHPGGNITGITDLADELTVKRLELLKELIPRLSRVALLNNPEFPATAKIERRVRVAAGTFGITVLPLYAKDRASLSLAVDSLEKLRAGALLIGGDALFTNNARRIIERATALRVPVAYYWPGTAEMGALFSHHADIDKNWERAAYYVDRILKGAKPSDLPIEQPARYELVLNRKVAMAFGITIPSTMILRADRVIE